MTPSPKLIDYAIRVATKVARRCNLDPDVAVSVAGELAVVTAARVDTELDSFKLFSHVVKRRLVPQICTELQVFGPKLTARAMRRRRNQPDNKIEREDFENVIIKPVRGRQPKLNMIDFFDQFSHDPALQQYITLVIAGYKQTELIREFGYTRTTIQRFKEQIENVYRKSAAD